MIWYRFVLGTLYINDVMALISAHTESEFRMQNSERLHCRDFFGGLLTYLLITDCLCDLSLASLYGCLRMWSLFLLNLSFFQCMLYTITIKALTVRPLPQKLQKILVRIWISWEFSNRLLVCAWEENRGMRADFNLKWCVWSVTNAFFPCWDRGIAIRVEAVVHFVPFFFV